MYGIPIDFVRRYLNGGAPVGDLVDKLHHTVVPAILVLFAFMISTKQWIGNPIQCWLPKEFSGQWNQYAEDYCFIHETYYAPIEKAGKITPEEKEENSASYYQWVPIFLTISAFCFYCPFFLYQYLLRKKATLDINKYVDEAISIKNGKIGDRKAAMSNLVDDFAAQVQSTNRQNKRSWLNAVRLYLVLKFVFCLNLIVQIWHMNAFLGHDSFWAVWSLFHIYQGKDWNYAGYFPRVTFCDFRVRDLGNVRPYSVQCVLMINMFNEKVYIFLWTIYVILFFITGANLLYTAYNFHFPKNLSKYINNMLNDSDPRGITTFDRGVINRYTDQILGHEALLTLRLIEAHTDRRLCVLINRALFEKILMDEKLAAQKNLIPRHDLAQFDDKQAPARV